MTRHVIPEGAPTAIPVQQNEPEASCHQDHHTQPDWDKYRLPLLSRHLWDTYCVPSTEQPWVHRRNDRPCPISHQVPPAKDIKVEGAHCAFCGCERPWALR